MFLENEDNGRFGKEELNGKLVIEWGGWPLSRRTPISNINCICYYMCINPIIVCNWLY
jgi:hypothetical protein